jgi:tetratricopeptide (TPR) repeat protein
MGRYQEAAEETRQAIALSPDYAEAWHNLGNCLNSLGRHEEAVEALRKAIDLKKDAATYRALSDTLYQLGRAGDAEAAGREAVKLDPRNAEGHFRLALALMGRNDADAAESYRRSNELMPYPSAAYNLGACLSRLRRWPEAEAAFRQAIQLDPKHAPAHHELGRLLLERGDLVGAAVALRTAVRLGPKDAGAHYDLGRALDGQGDFGGAATAYQEAIHLRPDFAEAHCNLGKLLFQQGRFAEALTARKRGHELGSKKPGWRYPSAEWVRQAERLVELDAKLPRVLKEEVQPADVGECLTLAYMCQRYKSLYTAASRFYAAAFTEQPKLADDLNTQHRYDAACAAALAGRGQGKDSDQSGARERARLCRQALAWLRADLSAYRRLLDKEPDKAGPTVREQMQHWQQDKDLAGVRDTAALAKLPEAEYLEWQNLWREVEVLRQRAASPPKQASPARP